MGDQAGEMIGSALATAVWAFSPSASAKEYSGARVYRGKVTAKSGPFRGRRLRAECYVMDSAGPGDLPQLVRVYIKGGI